MTLFLVLPNINLSFVLSIEPLTMRLSSFSRVCKQMHISYRQPIL